MAKFLLGLFAVVGMIAILGCDGDGDTIIVTEGGASGILPKSAAKTAIERAVPGGVNTIILSGGNGTTGEGGQGGYFQAELSCPAGLVFASGVKTPDASFSVPANEPTPHFGAEKLTVSSDMTLDVYLSTAVANASTSVGDYYLILGSSRIYRNATPLAPVVTGLEIREGATLTVGLTEDWTGGTGQDSCYLLLDEDVVVNGMLTIKDITTGTLGGQPADTTRSGAGTTADRGYLDVESNWNFFVGPNGVIDTSGDDATTADTRGGDGGRIYIYGRNSVFIHGEINANGGHGMGTGIGGAAGVHGNGVYGITIETNSTFEEGGMIVLSGGIINANGGDGSTGGDTGNIGIRANSYLYNTCPINASGGNGSNGDGGDAQEIYIYSHYCGLYNSGDITAVGGNAVNGDGGVGAYFDMSACDYGQGISNLYNSGNIIIDGGDAVNGSGGRAGSDIYFTNHGSGKLVNTGALSASGGDGSGAGSVGGNGPSVMIYQYVGGDYWYGEYSNVHDIIWSGNIDLHGGSAETGGDGGYIYLDNTDYSSEGDYNNSGTYFVGYQALYADGGEGGIGGDGGYFYCYTEDAESYGMFIESGLCIYMADIYARGGSATAGLGGNGGYVDIEVEGESYYESQVCLIHGDIHLEGGDGSLGGGDGIGMVTPFNVKAYHKVEIIGDVYGYGGNATAANGYGGYGAYNGVEISATYDVVINGNWYLYGGDGIGAGDGGYCDSTPVTIYAGRQVFITGEMQYDGGDSSTGSAGAGGEVWVFSQTWPTYWPGWSWDVSAGSGGTAGNEGQVWIDWVNWDR